VTDQWRKSNRTNREKESSHDISLAEKSRERNTQNGEKKTQREPWVKGSWFLTFACYNARPMPARLSHWRNFLFSAAKVSGHGLRSKFRERRGPGGGMAKKRKRREYGSSGSCLLARGKLATVKR